MLFLCIVLLLLAALSIAFRSLVLSRHAAKIGLALYPWSYDTGAKYAWLLGGLALLAVLAYKDIPPTEWWILCATWLCAWSAVWWLPSRLAKYL